MAKPASRGRRLQIWPPTTELHLSNAFKTDDQSLSNPRPQIGSGVGAQLLLSSPQSGSGDSHLESPQIWPSLTVSASRPPRLRLRRPPKPAQRPTSFPGKPRCRPKPGR
ncbi:hypothetical protein MLD38_005394 [Melastoma candidum]|uniref:Uncharacterized protein n=1 Tax=Melastoma candidum TaxID=119954 RepID=A0ACB9RJ80_9MYRT|nr:hypothetical protein MLD38_005394 [Melastoma candidum]